MNSIKEKLDHLGIVDRLSYTEFCKKWTQRDSILSEEELDFLNPDEIDNKAFWKYIDENFDNSVCGVGQMEEDKVHPIEKQNYFNSLFGLMTPLFGEILHCGFYKSICRVLEIGTGFGALKNILAGFSSIQYTGIDINPKIPDVLPTNGYHFPEELGKFDQIVSSNVFQHLSEKQRMSYYKESFRSLVPMGRFNHTIFVDLGNPAIGHRDKDGNAYMMHYGQYTVVPTPNRLIEQLQSVGFGIQSTWQRSDGTFAVNCYKPFRLEESK